LNSRLRGILLLLVGLVLVGVGVVTVFLLTRQTGLSLGLAPQAQPTEIPAIKSDVVVVTHDVRLGDLLSEADLTVISVATEMLPRNAIADPQQVVGKYVKTDMVQGEMVLEHNLAQPTLVNHDLAYILSDDHVLIAFEADDVLTRESIVQRGDVVDIYITITESAPVVDETQGRPTGTGTSSGTGTGTGTGSGTPSTNAQGEEEVESKAFTFAAFQNTNITAMVMEVVQQENQNLLEGEQQPLNVTPTRQNTVIRAYLLSMNPQDALVLKHLVDNGAKFDMVLRSPTNTAPFDLRPVTNDYIVELYGLEILK
jgi:pilus assembly protein CpaB